MEENLRLCKVCHILKKRILDGKWGNTKDNRWKDESGLSWNGSTCPQCNNNRIRLKMQEKRGKKNV